MNERTEHLALLERPIIQEVDILQSALQCQSFKRFSFILYCTGEAKTYPPSPRYFLKFPFTISIEVVSFNTRWVPSNDIKRSFLAVSIYNATRHLIWYSILLFFYFSEEFLTNYKCMALIFSDITSYTRILVFSQSFYVSTYRQYSVHGVHLRLWSVFSPDFPL